MARDLVDMFNDGGGFGDDFYGEGSHCHMLDGFDSQSMGMAMSFGDFLTNDRDDIDSLLDSIDVVDDYSASVEALSFQNRNSRVDVPAFEQHVYKVCGVTR
ncbi:hypothetical protein JZU46_00800 [bacterium]|nr:hypothetical protein [bacterium]